MIFGTYPCCDGELTLSMPERTPVMYPEDCPYCGKKVWHLLSRLEPMTYLEDDFLKLYDVDHTTKKITHRKPA